MLHPERDENSFPAVRQEPARETGPQGHRTNRRQFKRGNVRVMQRAIRKTARDEYRMDGIFRRDAPEPAGPVVVEPEPPGSSQRSQPDMCAGPFRPAGKNRPSSGRFHGTPGVPLTYPRQGSPAMIGSRPGILNCWLPGLTAARNSVLSRQPAEQH